MAHHPVMHVGWLPVVIGTDDSRGNSSNEPWLISGLQTRD